jgi:hypothetical protein
VKIFKWFNWGHGNFKVDVKAITGEASFFMNEISETNYQNNAYTGIALNAGTAEWSAKVNSTAGSDVAEVTLNRSDLNSYPKFCYNCWYYVTVHVETSAET